MHGGRRGDGVPGVEPPALAPAPRVECVEMAVAAPDIHGAVGDGRRGLDRSAGLHPPRDAAELLERGRREEAGVGGITAEPDIGMGGCGPGERHDGARRGEEGRGGDEQRSAHA